MLEVSLVTETVKNLLAVQETLIPGSGRSPGEGNGNRLQYSRLEYSFHGQRSLGGTAHGVAKSQT